MRFVSIVAAAVALILAWNVGLGLRERLSRPEPEPTPVLAVAPDGETSDEQRTIALFEAAKDSVVFISTAERVIDPWRRTGVERPRGTGSGFLWDAEGHVVTNWHVLEGADRATVRLADGSSLEGHLVGAAPAHDLAVLKIDQGGLPFLSRGESADLKVGQKVYAIGNPFGLDWTLTTGIVSALDRDLPGQRGRAGLRGLIQTDAAINPGNSGGPLLDSSGRLIGVNAAIFSPSGTSAGIGFAVPVDTLQRVVPQLIRTGHYAPPGIGVETDARVNALAARQGLDGVLVLGIVPGSSAEEAGLEPAQMTARGLVPGDVIVAVDGEPVATPSDMSARFDDRSAGDTVRLTLRRGRESRDVTVPLTPSG